MRVLVVEDDAPSRIALRKILTKAGYEAAVAVNGQAAFEMMRENNYDAVLTDWMMPQLDGLELIKKVRAEIKPSPAMLMITALDSEEARDRAIDAGADDYIAKPFWTDDVVNRLKNCLDRGAADRSMGPITEEDGDVETFPDFVGVGMAASTGGPQTMLEVFDGLGEVENAAFFVVLHGPSWMLESFEYRLQQRTTLEAKLAKDGDVVKPGKIYLAPGKRHMLVNPRELRVQLTDTPPVNYVRPAADPLFRSVARAFGDRSISTVLSGMGRDGSIGSGYVAAAGGMVIAQDPATAIIPAMPQTVVELRIAKIVSPLAELPGVLREEIRKINEKITK